MIAQSVSTAKERMPFSHDEVFDYSDILQLHGVPFILVNYYYQVGEISGTQGWLLHISIVRRHLAEGLDTLLPTLLEASVPFRVVQNKEIARTLLDGHVGVEKIGKVLTIYPASETQAVELSHKLVKLTANMAGPKVLTDIHLGGTIYTRYGAFKPILVYSEGGGTTNHIYDKNGALVPDQYKIPFELPVWVSWPFGALASPRTAKRLSILAGKYKIMEFLKADAKGNVMKGLYQKSLLKVRPCVIKQGVQHMWSDDCGRDMVERLRWQKYLHGKLASHVRLPAIIDLFCIDGDGYLVMEYIDGISLYDYARQQNPECRSWKTMNTSVRLKLIRYLIQMITIIGRLHSVGIIHRDVTPVNFMIDRTEQLCLIDIEMAYSFKDQANLPAYDLGSFGYMPPEQENREPPIFENDIYALGASIITIITDLPPHIFSQTSFQMIVKNIDLLIADTQISQMLAMCLQSTPASRPTISELKEILNQYQSRLKSSSVGIPTILIDETLNQLEVSEVLQDGINGLSAAPTMMRDGLWQSREVSGPDRQHSIWAPTHRFADGIAGTLYLLAKAKQAGYSIDRNSLLISNGWQYINAHFLNYLPNVPPGLFGGAAGLALTINEMIQAEMLEPNEDTTARIRECLSLPTKNCTIATGLAGQGLVLLQVRKWFNESKWKDLMDKMCEQILSEQQNDATWTGVFDGKKYRPSLSFAEGDSGIIYFLLKYCYIMRNHKIQDVAVWALERLQSEISGMIKMIKTHGLRSIIGHEMNVDAIAGIIKTLIAIHQITKEEKYANEIDEILNLFPEQIVISNSSIFGGLGRIGTSLLEAYHVLGNDQWKQRTQWIVSFLLNTGKRVSEKTYIWLPSHGSPPTADLMIGNSGIIQFLMQYENSIKTEKNVF